MRYFKLFIFLCLISSSAALRAQDCKTALAGYLNNIKAAKSKTLDLSNMGVLDPVLPVRDLNCDFSKIYNKNGTEENFVNALAKHEGNWGFFYDYADIGAGEQENFAALQPLMDASRAKDKGLYMLFKTNLSEDSQTVGKIRTYVEPVADDCGSCAYTFCENIFDGEKTGGYKIEEVYSIRAYPSDAERLRNASGGLEFTAYDGTKYPRWNYHVVPMLKVKTPSGGESYVIFDKMLFKSPVSLGTWVKIFSKETRFQTDIFKRSALREASMRRAEAMVRSGQKQIGF